MRQWQAGMVAIVCVMGAAPLVHARASEETPTPKQQAKAFFEEGVRKQQAGDYRGAIKAYDVSLGQDPRQATALSNRGFCYKQLKQYPKALADYEAALKLRPKLAEAHEYLGETHVAMGHLELARQEYAVLLKLDRHAAAELKEKIDAATPAPTP